MSVPKVREKMTPAPRTIGVDLSISTAKELMRRDSIRHLPVLEAGRLVGILSDRDVRSADSFRGPGELLVGEAMTPDPYVITEDTPLDDVLFTMAKHKYGCALVQNPDSKIVVGIFTDTDALFMLAGLLRESSLKVAA